MKEFLREWGGLAAEVTFGALSLYLDHTEQLNAMFGNLYPLLQPVLFVVIGFSIGRNLSKRRSCREQDSLKTAHAEEIAELNEKHAAEIAEKDAEIDRLKRDHDTAEQAGRQTAEPSLDAIMSLSQRAAAGVLDAMKKLDAGEKYVKFGDRIEDSLWLIRNSNGMIERHVTYFNGYHSRRDEYFVVPEWAAFLSIPENRKALERMAFCSRWPN